MLRLREMIREADKPGKPSPEAIRKLMSQMARAAVEEVNPAKKDRGSHARPQQGAESAQGCRS